MNCNIKTSFALLLAITNSAAVLAAEDMTIYGVVDIFAARQAGQKALTAIDGRGGPAGSRIGFKGGESLGSGLKAIYTLEYAINPDSNAGITAARQQFVGVESSTLGTLSAGFQYAPAFLLAPRFDVMDGSGLMAARAPLASAADATISSGNRARWSNSLAYTSPKLGGAQVLGIYANHDDETSAQASADNRWGLGASYNMGPLDVAVIYHNIGAGAGVKDTKEFFVAGSYNFGSVRVMGTYQQKDADGSTDKDNKLWSASFVVPVAANGEFQAGYAALNSRGQDNDGNSLTLGYIHRLSKRTSLYAAVNRLHYDRLATRTSSIEGSLAAGETANTYVAGITHRF